MSGPMAQLAPQALLRELLEGEAREVGTALALRGEAGVWMLAADTDVIDGSSEAAGAMSRGIFSRPWAIRSCWARRSRM
jgi:glycerate-2-kinase